ncbi:hypothetical protein L3X38_015555 [Prunus dulcis]|uniref:Uncharacterized protein n=1 Tax=Prunus dulcis TaxID=3755 RepID=A0AAD4W3Q9_PRUDU|nr:hypothetical protein L3X38_015555 [Prunus dulcis]
MAAGGGRSEPAKFRSKITIFRRLERRPISGEGWVVTPRPSRIDSQHCQHDALKGRNSEVKRVGGWSNPRMGDHPGKLLRELPETKSSGLASIKQNTVALSTAEAEYVSAAEATSQAKWLRFVLEDFGEEQVEGTPILCDNTSTIAMAKNLVFHQKTRHIRLKFHFIREAIQAKEIELIDFLSSPPPPQAATWGGTGPVGTTTLPTFHSTPAPPRSATVVAGISHERKSRSLVSGPGIGVMSGILKGSSRILGKIRGGSFQLIYCKTEDQIADILTKALSKDRFVYLRDLLGVKSVKGLEGSVDV